MSAVNEWIVREYFEARGYLVSQPRKYIGPSRQKKAEEEVSLLVFNPAVEQQRLPDRLLWDSADLGGVRGAVVGVMGWHSERLSATLFESPRDLLRFAAPEALRLAGRRMGLERVAVILCVPHLPVSGELKEKTLTTLRAKGIDGVISFRTILAELIAGIDKNRNYEKSDVLQMIRILKSYDFLKDSQMFLFSGRRKKRPAPAVTAPAPSASP
jgi:hypothetical protein